MIGKKMHMGKSRMCLEEETEQSFQVICWKIKEKMHLKKVFHTHRINEKVQSVNKDIIEAMAGFYLENEWSFRKERT